MKELYIIAMLTQQDLEARSWALTLGLTTESQMVV